VHPPVSFRTVNPTTALELEAFDETTPGELEAMVAAASRASASSRTLAAEERARPMRALARLLHERAADLAETMAIEMGKPLAQGEAEAQKCALTCAYYADHAERWLAPDTRATEARHSYVRRDPMGVVLAVMPWNFPLWQVFRFLAPALMAGNGAIVKHAPNVPRSTRAIAALIRDAGFIEGLVGLPFVGVEAVHTMLADPRIAAVTLTGSGRAGSAVAEQAGRHLKKCVLELGGSDPFIVLADADLDRAASVAATARLLNSGQSCIAAKRFIVVRDVFDAFVDRFVASMRAAVLGDPLVRKTTVGPQAREDLRGRLHAQVLASIARGADLVLGGELPEGPGWFYPPTVLLAVEPGMPVFDEETFGPVAAVVVAGDNDEAVALANASDYGLGACLWTRDLDRAGDLCARIDAGCVFVNELVKSDPRLPFGGTKRSGFGRELADLGLYEFTHAKTVWVADG